MNIQKIVRKNPKSLLNLGKFSNFQHPPFILATPTPTSGNWVLVIFPGLQLYTAPRPPSFPF